MISSQELALQMLAQLRILDPSISADLGTPERKIIDTVAQSLSDSQIDLDALSNALDIDGKYGAALDRFFRIFGFARKTATFATGYVTLSRIAASNLDIRVPSGTMVVANITAVDPFDQPDREVRYVTLFDVILPAGSLSVTVPVTATVPGTIGNVAANTINEFAGTTAYGLTSVTNDLPTEGGFDAESDSEFKVRFKNTLFRNLAGTQDQYMALAASTAYTTKANVVGPMSRYKEIIQIPQVADNAAYDTDDDTIDESGNGYAGEYTTALSTIPFAKYIYADEVPSFVSNAETGIGSFFYRQDYDFSVNTSIANKNRGDAYRMGSTGADWSFAAGSETPTARPNFTFKNVYTGVDATISAITPNSVVLVDFAYMSEASRNDITRNVTNAVDVFIDGGNETVASTIIPRPVHGNFFVNDSNSKFHYENYRRIGDPVKRPLTGNILTPLYWQPVLSLPASITIGTNIYYLGVHYWAVEDISTNGGTVRSRGGIEWSVTIKGVAPGDTFEVGDDPSILTTGVIVSDATGDPVGGRPVEIDGYTYDRNIVELQAALEGAKQVTTDVLAHRAKRRYFKPDVSVMYNNGANIFETNNAIRNSVDTFLKSQYFGVPIQLSDILNVIHNLPQVDNVRWSSDIPHAVNETRVFECDIYGNPLTNVTIERVQPGNGAPGSGTRAEIQHLFLTGRPQNGTFRLIWNGQTTSEISYSASAATIQAALLALSAPPTGIVVSDISRSNLGVRFPIKSFEITWPTLSGAQPAITADASGLIGGDFSFANDFFLRDDELAQLPTYALSTDTVAGMIIRPRAQGTWQRGS